MSRVAVVSAVRTPIGRAGRAYAGVHAGDLLAVSLKAAVASAGVDPEVVDEVLVGCTHQAGNQALNVARNSWLAAGLPYTTAATTVDTQCGSAQQAINLANSLIAGGQADVVVAGGVESLTRCPPLSAAEAAGGEPFAPSQLAHYDMPHQGIAGERVAVKYGVTREESDAFGLRSHLRAHDAWESGRFKAEVVTVDVEGNALLERDEGIRADSTLEPVYTDDGIITAGSASQLSDGSSAVLLASEDACRRHDLEPLAWVRRTIAVGVDPNIMMEGPIVATARLLERERLRLADIGLFEIHEAYATVVCAWQKVHPVDDERLNVDGGAISQGHPFGASGGRQLAHLVHTLRADGKQLGLQAMCCGGGIGTGTIVQVA